MENAKNKRKPLNSIALLFFMVIGAVLLTYLIPSGLYGRVEIDGRMAVFNLQRQPGLCRLISF